MTDRDELADLIYRTLNPEIQQDAGWMPTADGTGNVVSHITADAILARWRLVPVEPTTLGQERDKWASAYFGVDIAAQRRAADELTRHDQTAGHYDAGKQRCDARSHVGDRCKRTDPHDDASHQAKGYTWQGTYRTLSRTDNHGPHED